jgi:glucoamylase
LIFQQPNYDKHHQSNQQLPKYQDIYSHSLERIHKNMNPEGSIEGTVVASPSTEEPDYFYDWTRDSALVYSALQNSNLSITTQYIKSTKFHQLHSFGEPKFYVNGSLFDKPWGRPQNDGPALRIITLSKYILKSILLGSKPQLFDELYRNEMPANSIIKKDLEYISKTWREQSFDLWEETFGDHFYNRMVQLTALDVGSQIALLYNDYEASKYYKRVAKEVESSLDGFWDQNRGFIRSVLGEDRLDIAFLLACLHSRSGFNTIFGMSFECKSDKVLFSLVKLANSFEIEYPINYGNEHVLFGRYDFDIYDGTGTSIGNPWVLSTFAVCELLYTIVNDYAKDRVILISNKAFMFYYKFIPGVVKVPQTVIHSDVLFGYILGNLTAKADGLMDRVISFGPRFAEQIDRVDGFYRGARDLTWAYASFVTAFEAREKALSTL